MKELTAILAFIVMAVLGTIATAFIMTFIIGDFGITIFTITVGILLGLISAYSSYKTMEKKKKKNSSKMWS